MKNISFDEGLKTISLNNDKNRVISFNPSDFNLFARADKVREHLESWEEKIRGLPLTPDGQPADPTTENLKLLEEFDVFLRGEFNYIFNSDVYDVIFHGQSPLSIVGNVYLFEEFLNSAMPYIQEEMDTAINASQKRVEKYTKGYKK